MNKKILVLFAVVCFFSAVLFVVFNFCVVLKSYSEIVSKYATKYDLDENFVFAVIKAESDFDEKAVSKSGAIGLMQIMPATGSWIASELGKDLFLSEDLFDPETNVEFGCFYLNYLFGKFSDFEAVICAYNAGETVVRGWLDDKGDLVESKIEYEETRVYLKRVLEYFEKYQKT